MHIQLNDSSKHLLDQVTLFGIRISCCLEKIKSIIGGDSNFNMNKHPTPTPQPFANIDCSISIPLKK